MRIPGLSKVNFGLKHKLLQKQSVEAHREVMNCCAKMQGLDGIAVDGDATAGGLVEQRQQIADCALA